MKKLFAVLVSLILSIGVAISPLYAAGGQNHGDVGQGETAQGDAGNGVSPGDDAQGNQSN